jgi:hypothetical protein
LGQTLAFSGELLVARAHFDKGVALYDPAEHRQLAIRFGQDPIETILSARAWAMIALGFPDAAVADARQALKGAREINHAATLMHALFFSSFTYVCCKDCSTASALIDELAVLTEKKDAVFWKPGAMLNQKLSLYFDREGRRRNPNDDLWSQGMAVNGSDFVGAILLVIFGTCPR